MTTELLIVACKFEAFDRSFQKYNSPDLLVFMMIAVALTHGACLFSQFCQVDSTVLCGVQCLWPLRWAADLTSLWGMDGSPRRTCVPAGRPPTTPPSLLRAAWRPRAAAAASTWRNTPLSEVHSMRRAAGWGVSHRSVYVGCFFTTSKQIINWSN